MPSLKDLRARKKSVEATRKITLAMKMIAAAKLKKAEIKLRHTNDYYKNLYDVISYLFMRNQDSLQNYKLLFGNESATRHLLIVFTANRGLCGGFNFNVIRPTLQLLEKKDYEIVCVGAKGADLLARKYKTTNYGLSTSPIMLDAKRIMAEIIPKVECGEIGSIKVVYNYYHSAINQEVIIEDLVPFVTNDSTKDLQFDNVYEFEPNEVEVLKKLLPTYIETSIFHKMLQTATGEYGARVSAMDNASNNAKDLISDLTLTYNRLRQAYITKELTEIVSGVEAIG